MAVVKCRRKPVETEAGRKRSVGFRLLELRLAAINIVPIPSLRLTHFIIHHRLVQGAELSIVQYVLLIQVT